MRSKTQNRLEGRHKTRLAAILSCDMKSYSRLMEIDQFQGHEVNLNCLDQMIDKVQEFDGQSVKTGGDSVLAEFASALAAVECAVSIQSALRKWNKESSSKEIILVRAGVNIGEIIEEQGEIYGDGVNLAVRLQNFARPGGVCISSSVYEAIRSSTDLDFRDMGKHRLKNLNRPVQIYELRLFEAVGAKTNEGDVRKADSSSLAKHIMIVEDEEDQRFELSEFLGGEGFRLTVAACVEEALQSIEIDPPDLVITDIRMPGEDGLALLRKLTSERRVGIIVVSGKGDEIDRVVALELGADDYLVKPYSFRELLARIHSLLRRV